jgi:hypothetical protein
LLAILNENPNKKREREREREMPRTDFQHGGSSISLSDLRALEEKLKCGKW